MSVTVSGATLRHSNNKTVSPGCDVEVGVVDNGETAERVGVGVTLARSVTDVIIVGTEE